MQAKHVTADPDDVAGDQDEEARPHEPAVPVSRDPDRRQAPQEGARARAEERHEIIEPAPERRRAAADLGVERVRQRIAVVPEPPEVVRSEDRRRRCQPCPPSGPPAPKLVQADRGPPEHALRPGHGRGGQRQAAPHRPRRSDVEEQRQGDQQGEQRGLHSRARPECEGRTRSESEWHDHPRPHERGRAEEHPQSRRNRDGAERRECTQQLAPKNHVESRRDDPGEHDDPQKAGVPLHPLAGIEDEPLTPGEVRRIAVGDEAVVEQHAQVEGERSEKHAGGRDAPRRPPAMEGGAFEHGA